MRCNIALLDISNYGNFEVAQNTAHCFDKMVCQWQNKSNASLGIPINIEIGSRLQ